MKFKNLKQGSSSKCPASGQQRITDGCKIVCTALVSQLWRHNNKVAHFIQHKPPGRRPTLQNTLNQYFEIFAAEAET